MSDTRLATPANTPDEAAVKTLVESVATLIDRHDFITLERLYSDNVTRDYTSLNGGEPEVTTNAKLMMRWAKHLPGFDRTRHTLTNLTATVTGDSAVGEADVVAEHWIEDLRWTVSGRHRYDCARFGHDWRVVGQTFTFAGEEGDRAAAAKAGAAAAANPNAYVVRQQARDAVMALLTGFEDKDMERVNGIWAEDAVQEMPYAPPGFARSVVGRDALIRQYSPFATKCAKARFTDGLKFHDTQDPATVIAEYRAEIDWVGRAETYVQPYIGVFQVERGKIRLFRQYFDSFLFDATFGKKDG